MPQLAGFGQAYAVDPDNGMVYISWRSNGGMDLPLIITASDGAGAGLVWEDYSAGVDSIELDRIALAPWKELIASNSDYRVTGSVVPPGGLSIRQLDTGGVLGGRRKGLVRSLSAGGQSMANNDSIAIGALSVADSEVEVSNHLATAVGNKANAGYRGTAVGHSADSSYNDSVSIGESSQAGSSGSVSVGQAAVSGAQSISVGKSSNSGDSSVAVGRTANASANAAVSIGEASAATVSGGVSIGRAANAGHSYGVALGRDTATSAANQVAIGPRHLELDVLGSAVGVPGAGQARLQLLDVGGKMELSVQFHSGAKQVLATEP